MTIGNYLTSQAKVTEDDQVIILSGRNGGTRRASVGAISEFVEKVISSGGGGGGGGGASTWASLLGNPTDSLALKQFLESLEQSLRTEISGVDSGASAAIADLLQGLNLRLRFDGAQTLTDAQKARAALNLGITTRLLPLGERLPGQVPVALADGTAVWAFIPGVTSTVDPLVTQAIAISNQVSGAMRLRTISLGAE